MGHQRKKYVFLLLNKCLELLQLHFFFAENAFTTTTFGNLRDKEGVMKLTNRYEEEQDLNIPEREKNSVYIIFGKCTLINIQYIFIDLL
jgi:hypothetical protein